MKKFKEIVILCGGISGEREVSIRSAQCVYEALKNYYPVRSICLDRNALPEDLNPETDFIFPLVHGDFGEDGALQRLLDQQNFAYLGSDVAASECCIHKMQSKRLAQTQGIPVLPALALQPRQPLDRAFLEDTLQCTAFALKPENKGSSLGVHLCPDFDTLQAAWDTIHGGLWMLEPYIHGRELTIGLLQGQALGVVEIRPKHGFYDYHNKYTVGASEYLYPAPIPPDTTKAVQSFSAKFFKAAQCLDFGRADFLLEPNGNVWFLEMNTIPGVTAQSLVPKSAACVGLAFSDFLKKMVEGAQRRFE